MQTDVFMSYAREDIDTARSLANALGAQGLSVWWDRNIPAGENLNAYIERMLQGTRRVIVLWSQHSVMSRWVQAEADFAAERGVLLPIITDECQPPLSFRQIHATMLKDWRQEDGSVDFTELASILSPLIADVSRTGDGDRTDAALDRDLLLQQMLEGLLELMRLLGQSKMQHTQTRTIIGTGANNPLKFALDADQLMDLMTSEQRAGWMSAPEAVEAAFRDLKAHQKALALAAVAAVRAERAAFDPARLEQAFDLRPGAFDWLAGGGDARKWRLYCEQYAEHQDKAEEIALDAFRQAYAEEMDP